MDLKKDDEVWILDSFQWPLNIRGTIVGKVGNDHYNVLIDNGLMEGDIVKYKYWKLFLIDREQDLVIIFILKVKRNGPREKIFYSSLQTGHTTNRNISNRSFSYYYYWRQKNRLRHELCV